MTPITLTFLFLAIAAVLLITNALRPDIIALILLLAFGLSGILTPQEAFSGFSRQAIFVMLAAFILAEGLRRSGLTDVMGASIVRLFGKGQRGLVFGVMLASAIFSLFMNNVAAASLLLPALSGVARRAKISVSRLLIPLAFGTILGGMATLLTTMNLIVSGILRDHDIIPFGLLDFAPVGLPLALAGIFFVVLWGYKSLPEHVPAHQVADDKKTGDSLLDSYHIDERIQRGRIISGGGLEGKTIQESQFREKYQLNIIAIQRSRRLVPPDAQVELRGGDILLFTIRPEDNTFNADNGLLEILPAGQWQQEYLSTPDLVLIDAAIAPRSHLAGQTLQTMRFEQKFGARVLAIWRRGRALRTRLADLPLEFGDGLLLQGSAKSLELLRTEPGIMLLAESEPASRLTWRSLLAGVIMLATLACASLFQDMIAEIMLGGAIAMILSRLLNADQAYDAVEWRSLILVGGMLSVGVAMAKTGAAASLADGMIAQFGRFGPLAILAGLVLLTVLLTQIINGAAAATVIAPIAIAAAQKTGTDPRSLAMAVALASSMAFMSPLGHAVNVMVMGAGGYTFRDYARIGTPLTILLVIILLILLPILVPLGG